MKNLFLLLLGMLVSITLSCHKSLETASAKEDYLAKVTLTFRGSLHLLTDQLKGRKCSPSLWDHSSGPSQAHCSLWGVSWTFTGTVSHISLSLYWFLVSFLSQVLNPRPLPSMSPACLFLAQSLLQFQRAPCTLTYYSSLSSKFILDPASVIKGIRYSNFQIWFLSWSPEPYLKLFTGSFYLDVS